MKHEMEAAAGKGLDIRLLHTLSLGAFGPTKWTLRQEAGVSPRFSALNVIFGDTWNAG